MLHRTRASLATALALPLTAALAAAQCPPTVLVPSTPAQVQWFGTSVRVEGDHLLASAPVEDDQIGTVYAFRRDPATGLWTERQRIKPGNPVPGMRFGRRVEVSNGRFVATSSTAPGALGAVWVFEFDAASDQWVQRDVIVEPGPGNYAIRITLDGDRLAVTERASWHLDDSFVHFYRLDPVSGRFTSDGVISSADGSHSAELGSDVVFLDPSTAVVGDYEATFAGVEEAGTVSVFEQDPVTGIWDETSTISSIDPGYENYFGGHVVWDGEQLLVSEPGDDEFADRGGAVLVFERNSGGGFDFVQKIGPERPIPFNTVFGGMPAFGDGQVWVRSQDEQQGTLERTVERWLRDDLTGRWRKIGRLVEPLLGATTTFSAHGDYQDGTLFLGADWSSISASPQGRVYVYEVDECDLAGTRYCDPAPATSAGTVPVLSAFGSTDVPEASLSLRATGLPPGTTALALGSPTAGVSTPPGSAGPLCLGGSVARLAAPLAASGAGSVNLHLDVNSLATPLGPVAVVPGDTWHFQVWFRDVTATTTSGFTDAARITYF